MKIYFSERFSKRFKKLPTIIQNKFEDRLSIFVKTPNHPILKSHLLKGNFIGYRAFSITGDYRVIYRIIDNDCVKLVDIGTHSQVYE